MRKLFAVAALFALSTAPVHAQGLEFSGGVNISELSGDAIENAARELGANFGIDIVIPIGPLGLNLGGAWSEKGVEETDGATTSTIDLSYIELPVHLRFPLYKAGPLRWNLVAGPTLGINTGCEIKASAAAATDCKDAVDGFSAKNVEWAGVAGTGLSFHLGGLAYAGVDLVYSFGITAISDAALAAKSRTWALTSHLGFDLF